MWMGAVKKDVLLTEQQDGILYIMSITQVTKVGVGVVSPGHSFNS